jgi:hypothetical protein
MKLNLNRIGAFFVGVGSAAAILASAAAANAATFTVNGTDYDVTTVSGNFISDFSLRAQLQSQVWWGNQSLAQQFARTVGSSLGFVNDDFFGPFFAYGVRVTPNGDILSADQYGFSRIGSISSLITQQNATYAIATPITPTTPQSVPEPGATIPVAVVSLIALGALKSRKSVALKNPVAL